MPVILNFLAQEEAFIQQSSELMKILFFNSNPDQLDLLWAQNPDDGIVTTVCLAFIMRRYHLFARLTPESGSKTWA